MADASSRLEIILILKDKATKELKKFARSLKKVTREGTAGVKRLNTALVVTGTSLVTISGGSAAASTGMIALSTAVTVTSASITALGFATVTTGQALLIAPAAGVDGFSTLGPIIDITAVRTFKLTAALRAMAAAAITATTTAIGGFRAMAASINTAATSMLLFGGRLAAVALGVAAVVRGTKGFLDFGTAMAEVNTIFKGTAEELEIAGERVRDFSRNLGLDQIKVAKGLYQTLSSGITDTADAFLVLEQAAELGVAGVATTRESVDLLTGQINAFGLEVSGPLLKALSDLNFKTVELGKTTIPELSKSMGKAAPLAAQLGISLVEVNAVIATLTKANIDTTEAFTGLRAILNNLLQPSEDAKVLLKAIGIESGALAIETFGLKGVLDRIKVAYEGNTEALTSLFNNVRAATPVLALTGNQAESFAKIIKELGDAAGTSGRALDKQLNTPARRLKIVFTGLTQGLEDLSEAFFTGFGFAEDSIESARASALRLKLALDGLKSPVELFGKALSTALLGLQGLAHGVDILRAAVGNMTQEELDMSSKRLLINAELTKVLIDGGKISDRLARQIRRLNVQQSGDEERLLALRKKSSQTLFQFTRRLRLGIKDDAVVVKRILGEFDRATEQLGIRNDSTNDKLREMVRLYEELNGVIIDPSILVVRPEVIVPSKEELFRAGAEVAKTFGQGFKAELDRFKQSLSAENVGADFAASLFGTLSFAIDDFSRRIVDSELTFKGFTKQLLKDLAALIIRMQLLRALGGLFGGGGGGGIELGGSTPGPGGGFSSPFAEGGIMPGKMLGHKSLPVNSYAHGGIATTPQIAIFGEGKSAGGEAFVPLGGDRKIPVKIEGGGGGGGVQATVSLTVTSLDPRGAADVILEQFPLIEKKLAASIQAGSNRGLTTAIRSTARGGR